MLYEHFCGCVSQRAEVAHLAHPIMYLSDFQGQGSYFFSHKDLTLCSTFQNNTQVFLF